MIEARCGIATCRLIGCDMKEACIFRAARSSVGAALITMTTQRAQVAESSFNFLHMELVQMALGELPEGATSHSTSQLQQASRKVEAIGFQVGVRLVERYTKDRPRFSDTLEIIKFLCKDFWMEVYRKQIDKLQTNNRVRFKRQRPGPF